jgi:hypothetical protein
MSTSDHLGHLRLAVLGEPVIESCRARQKINHA